MIPTNDFIFRDIGAQGSPHQRWQELGGKTVPWTLNFQIPGGKLMSLGQRPSRHNTLASN
jgi:hypothetical protein